MKPLIALALCGIFITQANAQAQPKREWGPEQATGAPDTKEAGDLPTAWASLEPDAGSEWLEVSFEKAVEIDEVRIRETFNPGTICKIVAISNNKKEIVLWEGEGNPMKAPADMVVRPVLGIKSNQIKIHLDTKRVRGWNEIDAVELVGIDGSHQWATRATASSFYVVEKIPSKEVGEDEFLFELLNINQPDADKYLVSAENVRKYIEWQSPPHIYWGPTTNGVEGTITYKFPLPGNATQIYLKASSLAWDFFNEPGGNGRGCSMLEASRDGVTWIALEDKMNPRQWGADWTYEKNLPIELLGSSEIWIRVKMLVERAPNSSYTVAQFARGHDKTTDPVFVIRATSNPNPKDFRADGFPAISKMTEMVPVQGGTLPQGSELAGQVVDGFQIGKYEVTWGEWKTVRDWAVTNYKGYDLANLGAGSGDNHPVRNVNWYDVVKWCNAKSQMEGLTPVYQFGGATYKTGQSTPSVDESADGYRLPLEKEWEWAARGGTSSQSCIYSGSNDVNVVAWYDGNSLNSPVIIANGRGTWPIGQKAANELGLFDMSGNVFEWCWDLDQIQNRYLRGGGWHYYGQNACRVADRSISRTQNTSDTYLGFRYARNAVSDTSAPSNLTEMVPVQGGTLPQGSELAGQVVDSFQIGKYEVTWGLWKEVRDWAVANNKGYDLANIGNTYPQGRPDNFPVVYVSWYDAVKWCNARSEKEGLVPVYQVNWETYKNGQMVPVVNSAANGYRLCIDKEWEWAARGGLSSKGYTYSGSNDPDAVAWTQENTKRETKGVGTKQPNELGIYDMSGNVFEWCWDKVNAIRKLRGGGWFFPVEKSTVSRGDGLNPDGRYGPFGFRVARNSTN